MVCQCGGRSWTYNSCTIQSQIYDYIYLSMGTAYCCQEYYQALPFNNSKSTDLKAKLRQHFHNSQFRDICLRTVERHYDDALELEKEEVLRHSVATYSHYESNCISQSISEDNAASRMTVDACTYSHVAAMPPENRERYLLKLIRESYLFLDFSDCIDNRHSYDQLMRNEVMRGDPSLVSAVGQGNNYIEHLEEELRSFNEELIGKLQNYVRFCRKVKHDFTPDRERFLSKLNLALQADIIRKYLNRDFRKSTGTLQEMMADVEEILRILVVTVETMYDFRLQGEGLLKQEEFFNSLNIYTMLTSILFESEEFAGFIINKLKECFRQRFTAYRAGGTYSIGDFVSDFIALNSNDSRRETRLTHSASHLLSYSKYDSIPIFERTQRMLLKLFAKPVPIFKLKVVFELTQEMTKEMEELRVTLKDKYGVSLGTVFTRETDLLAIKWLLRRSSERIEDICSHLLFTYYFVHRMHLVDRKGSSLITFMQEVERIVQWARPI